MDKLLILDDNFEIINTLKILLEKEFKLFFASTVKQALEILTKENLQIALLDVDLPDGNGLTVLDNIRQNKPECDVIMMSGVATAHDAFRAVRSGAYDFLDKPLSEDKLKIILKNLYERRRLQKIVGKVLAGQNMLTADPDLLNILKEADKIAQSSLNVLITGDSGTGKEMLAAFIHAKSKRNSQPFIKVNCAAITDTLFETEFFGHQKGSFTGAIKDKKGKFELADGGTLFLDEVGELPLNQQTKLLRVLEDREFYRVGSEKSQKSDVRVISATNQDLEDMIADKSFREDLFYRLNVVNFHIPRLKERPADVLLLGGFFLKSIAEIEGMPEKQLSQEACIVLQTMEFPGNIRELKNLMHKLFFISMGDEITAEDIRRSVNIKRDNLVELNSDSPAIFEETRPLGEAKKILEKEYIIKQLKKHEGNVSVTALALKVLPNNLFRKIKELGIK